MQADAMLLGLLGWSILSIMSDFYRSLSWLDCGRCESVVVRDGGQDGLAANNKSIQSVVLPQGFVIRLRL